jgi:hypothetical protein
MLTKHSINELTQEEVKYWALFAHDILERIFGEVHDEDTAHDLYNTYKDKFYGLKRQALDYFYNWRLNHLQQNESITRIKELLLIKNCKQIINK